MKLISTVERKEFNTELPIVGKPIHYIGDGVLGNQLVSLDEYLLVVAMDKTTIEVVDSKKRTIVLDIMQVSASQSFTLVILGTDEHLVAAEPEPEQQPEPDPVEDPEVVAPDKDPEPEPLPVPEEEQP